MKNKNFVTVTSLNKYPKFEIDHSNKSSQENSKYNTFIPPLNKNEFWLSFFYEKGTEGISMRVPKRVLRLLAKRINSHLEALKR